MYIIIVVVVVVIFIVVIIIIVIIITIRCLQESKGGDCDTYTDGACSLLRRKMYKARRASCPVLDVASVVGTSCST